jgi:hypothetical protein
MPPVAPLPAPIWLFKPLHFGAVFVHVAAIQLFVGVLLLVLLNAGRPDREGFVRLRSRLPALACYALVLALPPVLLGEALYGPATALQLIGQAHGGLATWGGWGLLLGGAGLMGGAAAAFDSSPAVQAAGTRLIVVGLIVQGVAFAVMAPASVGSSWVWGLWAAASVALAGLALSPVRFRTPQRMAAGVGVAILLLTFAREMERDGRWLGVGYDVWSRPVVIDPMVFSLIIGVAVLTAVFIGSVVVTVFRGRVEG